MSATISQALQTALAAHKAGRLAEAQAAYESILGIDPDNPDALHLSGLVRLQRGNAAVARDRLARAVALRPRMAPYHMNLGRAQQALGLSGEAVASFRQAAALAPGEGAVWQHLALALRGQGDVVGAIDALRRAAQAAPHDAAPANNLSAILLEQGRLEEAWPAISRARSLAPDNALTLCNEGQALLLEGRAAEALVPLRRAVVALPDNAMILNSLGVALQDSQQVAEAVDVLARAVALAPTSPILRVSYGNALKKHGCYDAALAEFEQALAMRPDVAEIHSHIGTCHDALLRHDAAIASYDRALTLKPDYARAQQNRAMTLLTLGHFKNGWQDYVARDNKPNLLLNLLASPHGADDIRGQRVLLCGEQGLGDEIFFLRFLPELRRRGVARVTYIADAKIAALLARCDGLDAVQTAADALPPAETTIAIGDLPLVLRMTTAGQIPPSISLPPLPTRMAEIAARLAACGPPPYIGVTWRAGIAARLGALFKLAPLADLGTCLRVLSGTLIALQRLPQEGEIAALAAAAGKVVHDLTALNDDLEAMLALLAQLDDYIAVSNTNMHLRAAAGRTSRVLVPCPPEFRWMASGDESPWFPGSPLYRQAVDRTWTVALARLSADLRAAVG